MIRTIKFFLHAVYAAITAVVLVSLTAALVIYLYGRNLPDHKQLRNYRPPTVTRFYSADGMLLAEYAKEHRIFLPIDQIPANVISAFISAEDKNFYENQGIDLFGIVKAMIKNVYKLTDNKRLIGGSTITQQVVKNFLLNNERTIKRKIKEAILAYRITSFLSKDKIIELYLNHIYLGNGSYGIASAALKYFDKPVGKLSLDEIALLAALPKAPSKLNPLKHYDAAINRRNWVLQRMYEDGYIDEVSKKIYQSMPIAIQQINNRTLMTGDFFVEETRKTVVKRYGEDGLLGNGLTVYTTLSPQYQELAKKALRNGLEAYDKRHGWRGPLANIAENLSCPEYKWHLDLKELRQSQYSHHTGIWKLAVVLETSKDNANIGFEDSSIGSIKLPGVSWAHKWLDNNQVGPKPTAVDAVLKVGDIILVSQNTKNPALYQLQQIPRINGAIMVAEPESGRILAMVGGYSYADNQFNRATQAMRQPGSVFKTIIYLSALENGLTPNSIVLDDRITIDQGAKMPLWQPRNIGNTFMGPITMRTAFEQSRNLATIRLAKFVGMEKITETARKLHIYSNPLKNLVATLGSEATTLSAMVRAYAIIANGGYDTECHLIERIQNNLGETVYQKDYAQCDRCYLPEDAPDFKMLTPLPPKIHQEKRQLIDPISAYQMISLLEGGVKNGTGKGAQIKSQYIGGKTGTTNDSMDTWFIGFTDKLVVGVYVGFDTPESMGKKETGARAALPIFKNFMQEALQIEPSAPFRAPLGINLVKVDKTTGIPLHKIQGAIHGNPVLEPLEIGKEYTIMSLIERKHYYDAEHNQWMVAIEEDGINEIIDSLSQHEEEETQQ